MSDDKTVPGGDPKPINLQKAGEDAARKVIGGPASEVGSPGNRTGMERWKEMSDPRPSPSKEGHAARHEWNTVDDSTHLPARILWPALGFPAVISPGSGDTAIATRTVCLLVLSNRNPQKNPLSKRDVARHLRMVPWAQRREKRYLPADSTAAFKEEEIEVRHTESFLDDGRAQLINLTGHRNADDPQGERGFVIGVSSYVLDFYASKLPEKQRLPYMYEIKILEHAMTRFSPDLYHLFWVNAGRKDDKKVRSEEMNTLLEHFARSSRFGKDGVLPLSKFVGKTRQAYEQKYVREYEYELNQPEVPDHRTEVLHPVFIREPAVPLRIGHLTDLHMDTRIAALDQKLRQSGAKMHNWNQACKDLYDKAKADCDILFMTGDLIDYGRGYNGHGPMNSDKSYWRDRNWFIFYEFLAAGLNYSKPVYTTLGNHDWRINPYPLLNDSAPKPHEVGADPKELNTAYGPGAKAKSYSTDPGMVGEGLAKVFFARDGSFEVSRTALVTNTASVAWYLMLINPFLDYAWRLPGGYNMLMLDWAEDELVDPHPILGGVQRGRGLVPDNYGGPLAKNCLTKVQKAVVEHVAAAPSGPKILGIHQPPVGPHEHWSDDDLDHGRVRYTANDLKAAWDALYEGKKGSHGFERKFQGSDDQRKYSLHRLSGARFDEKLLYEVAVHGLKVADQIYPTLAIRTQESEPLGREATCGSFVVERDWLIRKLREARFNVVLSGHIHRRHVLVIDDSGNGMPAEWRGKWVVRKVASGKPPAGFKPLFVNSTSAGPLGHIYAARGKYLSAASAYTSISIAASGAVESVEFKPEESMEPVVGKSPSPWIDEGAPIGAK